MAANPDFNNFTRRLRKGKNTLAYRIVQLPDCYGDLQRAFRILQLHPPLGRKNNPTVEHFSPQRWRDYLNELLGFIRPARVAPVNERERLRRRRAIAATRKVLRAVQTVCATTRPEWWDDLDQQVLRFDFTANDFFPERPWDPVALDIRPKDEFDAHLGRLDDDVLRATLRMKDTYFHPTGQNVEDALKRQRRHAWKYDACREFYANVVEDEDEGEMIEFMARALPMPHDTTSLWSALSYCVWGRTDRWSHIKGCMLTFFNDVLTRGQGLANAAPIMHHRRHKEYVLMEKQTRRSARVNTPENVRDFGRMSLYRSLCVNRPDDWLPGYTMFEEIFWVIADYFGTEVIVFVKDQNDADRDIRNRDQQGNVMECGMPDEDDPWLDDPSKRYVARVYGREVPRNGWPNARQHDNAHPLYPRLLEHRSQIMLVTDKEFGYVMPVDQNNMWILKSDEEGWEGIDKLDTSAYRDDVRWPPVPHRQGAPDLVHLLNDPQNRSYRAIPCYENARGLADLFSQQRDRDASHRARRCLVGEDNTLVMPKLLSDNVTGHFWARPGETDLIIAHGLDTQFNRELLAADGEDPRNYRFHSKFEEDLSKLVNKAHCRGVTQPAADPLNGQFTIQRPFPEEMNL